MRQPSVRDVDALLTAPGQPFEIEIVDIDGRPTKTWKHAPRSIGDALDEGRRKGGDRPFLVLEEARVSHAAHWEQVLRVANSLVSHHGVEKGDRVAIAMRNLPEWSVSFFAASIVGAVAVPLNAFWNGVELGFSIRDCEPKVLVADGERLERLVDDIDSLRGVTVVGTRLDDRKTTVPLPEGVLPFDALLAADPVRPAVDIAPEDPATLFYTSGTTSHPKGVYGTHRNFCSTLLSMRYTVARGAVRAGVDPAAIPQPKPSVVLVPVPLFHATGCHSNLATQAYQGGTVVFMRRWDPEAALELIERERATGMSGVPAMAWDLVNAPSVETRDLTSLQSLGGGGAASPPELLRRIQEVLPGRGSGTGYGMTESSSLTASIGGADYVARPRSVGVPVPICDVRIVDDDGNDVPEGEIGEIWIAGPTVVPGYWRRPEDTAATFGGGWLRSGDLGRVDEEGFLYIVDRAKDMVIRGGENISSIEVEAALYDHPAVLEAAVFAVPHPTLGEEVGAVVCRKSGASATPEELRAHAADRLASFKVPTHIWVTDDPLPRGPTGKFLKREVRAAYTVPAT
jgi:acyl-CoA synthetase (AMP-forming)/AMP-acid ligase II